MRSGGFDAVSFRDLATEVGVKSASVHYHFPQKVDLDKAVVLQYGMAVAEALGDATDKTLDVWQRLEPLFTVYRQALTVDSSVCLCCMLGAEARYLPEELALEVAHYFKNVQKWTIEAFSPELEDIAAQDSATFLVSGLQGAMVLAIASGDTSAFDATEKLLKTYLKTVLPS